MNLKTAIFFKALGVVLVGLGLTAAKAAIDPASSLRVDSKIVKRPAVVIGGKAGQGFSLLSVNKANLSDSKTERWVFEIGDLMGNPNKGLPGYYHAQLRSNPDQLIIDFSQMPLSLLSEAELRSRLRRSSFIKNSTVIVNPDDKTLTLILDLNQFPKLRILQVKGEKTTSKVLVDFVR